jgi:hypothetical protein
MIDLCCQVRPLGHRRRATAYAFRRNQSPLSTILGKLTPRHHPMPETARGATEPAVLWRGSTIPLTDFVYMNLGGTAAQAKSVNFLSQAPIPIATSVQTSVGMNLNAKIWTVAGGYTALKGDWETSM